MGIQKIAKINSGSVKKATIITAISKEYFGFAQYRRRD
jgi:hypothetical protein